MERRRFLGLIGGTALAGLLTGCERKVRRLVPIPDAFGDDVDDLAVDATLGLQVFLGAGELLVGPERRLPFGLVKRDGIDLHGARAQVLIGTSNVPYDAEYRTYARAQTGDPPGFYATSVSIPPAPIVDVMVVAEAEGQKHVGFTTFKPRKRPHAPAPGEPAVSVATPTTGHPRGVATICTRTPPCPMHDVRLDRALATGRPVVLTIASPRLCSSRTCGPVVDEVTIVRESLRDRATFIHAEVYKGDTPTTPSPTFRRWRLESEPWTFVIDAQGAVRARFEGPVTAREIEDALLPVTAP